MLRERFGTRFRWLLVVLVGSVALGCGGGDGHGDGDTRTLLQKLGVKDEDLGQPRTDSDRVQPLRKKTFVHRPTSQLYLSGVTTAPDSFEPGYGAKHQLLLDDDRHGFEPLFSTENGDWYTYEATSAAADLKGEGQQQAVVLYRNPAATPAPKAFLRFTGWDLETKKYYEKGPYEIPGDFTFGHPLGTWNDLQIAVGDLDRDGADELVIAAGKTILVMKYEVEADRFTVLDEVIYHPTQTMDRLTTVAVGDVDTDGEPEVVTVDGAYDASVVATYFIYSFDVKARKLVEKESGTVVETDEAGSKVYGFARIAIGDLNGDNLNELAFVGEVFNWTLAITIYRYDRAEGEHVPLTTREFAATWDDFLHQRMPVAAVLRPDGDPTQNALLAGRYILKLDGNQLACKWGSGACGPVLTWPVGDRVTVGDLNGDGRDDVAYVASLDDIFPSAGVGPHLMLWTFNAESGAFGPTERWQEWPLSVGVGTTLTALSTDRSRNRVLQYKSYEFLYSNPRVVAVLVSPPVYAGQDVNGDGSTAIGWEAGTQVDRTETHGFYAGLSLGFHADAPIWGSLASQEFKLNVDTSMDWSFTSGSEQSASKTFTTGSGEDQVVFVSVPYDIYHYTVVSSPDGKAGYDVAIQVPRTPIMKPFNLDLFNSIVPAAYQVPAAAFNPATGARHAAYDPWSYPTRAEMQAILPMTATGTSTDPDHPYTTIIPADGMGGFRTPDEMVVGVGTANTGFVTLGLEYGTSNGYGRDFNLQVGIEAEAVAGGVLIGGRSGYHYGYSSSYNTTSATSVTGQVPSMPISMAGTLRSYSVGLFAYAYPNDGTPQYTVVNYWTE